MSEARTWAARRRRAKALQERRDALKPPPGQDPQLCSMPFCSNPTQRTEGLGFNGRLCRPHLNHRATHGDLSRRSLPSSVTSPLRRVAQVWLEAHASDDRVAMGLAAVARIYYISGRRYANAWELRLKRPRSRAHNIIAKWAALDIPEARVLATYLSVHLALAMDGAGPSSKAYRAVQYAKSAHRIASGSKRRKLVGFRATDEIERHYPESRGRVLVHLGDMLQDAFEATAVSLAADILAEVERLEPKRKDLRAALHYLRSPVQSQLINQRGKSIWQQVRVDRASGQRLKTPAAII